MDMEDLWGIRFIDWAFEAKYWIKIVIDGASEASEGSLQQ